MPPYGFMTHIRYNGNRFNKKSLDDLFMLLATEPLDRRYAPYVVRTLGSAMLFHGNFDKLSYAFSVETDDDDLIAKFIAHLRANERIGRYE